MSAPRRERPTRRRRLPEALAGAARIAAADVGLWAGAQAAAALPFFSVRPMALTVAQAAWAEWGAGRLGVAWSDPLAPPPTGPQIARRAAIGAAWGAAGALGVAMAALVAGGASFAHGAPRPSVLFMGLLPALATTLRDELLQRGVVLRALRRVAPSWASVLACGAVAAAARYGADGALGLALLVEGLRGVALAAMWVRDRGTWMPWAANAAWTWTLGAVLTGGLVDLRFAAEADATPAAALIVAAGAVLGWVGARRRGAPSAS